MKPCSCCTCQELQGNQEVRDIVWACFVAAGHRQSSVLWAQVAAEEELGQCSPTVFQGNVMVIFLDAVWIWWNNQSSILHKSSTTVSFLVCPCTYTIQTRYVRVCTKYVLVCTNMYQRTANLWVEGMEAHLWQIEGIASCMHHTPEQLRLPFHTAKGSHSTVHYMCSQNMVELLVTMLVICMLLLDVWHPRVCITLRSTKSCQTGLSDIHPGVYRYTPSTYQYILVCIKYILVHPQHVMVHMSMYWYIPVCTKSIPACTEYILICTFLYQVHTSTCSVHIITTLLMLVYTRYNKLQYCTAINRHKQVHPWTISVYTTLYNWS